MPLTFHHRDIKMVSTGRKHTLLSINKQLTGFITVQSTVVVWNGSNLSAHTTKSGNGYS
jgi:hypothetical protein